MTDLDFVRFLMAQPATTTAGAQGGPGRQLFPELMQRLTQMQMQQSNQGPNNGPAYMQLAQMPGNVLGALIDRYQTPPPAPPGRTNFPLGRWGHENPERYPVLPKVPDTRDQGLKAGGFRQLPWWLEV